MANLRFKVRRSAVMGGHYGPTTIGAFLNQVDAELFARAETMRATAEGEDVSVTVVESRREVCTYHSDKARARLDLPSIEWTRPTIERELRAYFPELDRFQLIAEDRHGRNLFLHGFDPDEQ